MERKLAGLPRASADLSAQLEALALTGAKAAMDFEAADEEMRRRVLTNVLCNLEVEDGHIASYQYKDPFEVLQMDSSGALLHPWWALEDLNL